MKAHGRVLFPRRQFGLDAPSDEGADMPAVRPVVRYVFVETEHVYGGYRFRHIGTGVFEFDSRSGNGTYTVDLAASPPCSCWPSLRPSSVAVCPHLRVLQAFLKKQKERQP